MAEKVAARPGNKYGSRERVLARRPDRVTHTLL